MALLPILLRELLDTQNSANDMCDQHFSLGLLENELLRPARLLSVPFRSGYLRPWRSQDEGNSGLSSVQSNTNEYRINLDVQQFKPEELKVKVENGFIIVDAKHEERSDQHGFISRQFTRKYVVPENVNINALTSDLSSDGVLTLKAPKKMLPQETGREIPITFTNSPAVKSAEEKPETNGVTDEKSKL